MHTAPSEPALVIDPAVVVDRAYLWAVALVAALGGLLFGCDWVVIGGAARFYEDDFQLAGTSAISAEIVGPHVILWIYAAICLGGFSFVLRWLPETKARSLEQIERELAS